MSKPVGFPRGSLLEEEEEDEDALPEPSIPRGFPQHLTPLTTSFIFSLTRIPICFQLKSRLNKWDQAGKCLCCLSQVPRVPGWALCHLWGGKGCSSARLSTKGI